MNSRDNSLIHSKWFLVGNITVYQTKLIQNNVISDIYLKRIRLWMENAATFNLIHLIFYFLIDFFYFSPQFDAENVSTRPKHRHQMQKMPHNIVQYGSRWPFECAWCSLFKRRGHKSKMCHRLGTSRAVPRRRASRCMDPRGYRKIGMDERQTEMHQMRGECWFFWLCHLPEMWLSGV